MPRRPRIVAVNPAEGVYEISGSLDGVRFDDRVVRMLTVRRLGKEATEGLRPLAPLRDLRRLHLERISGVDLTPLAALELEILGINEARDVDLAPLADLAGLWYLHLVAVRDCRLPARVSLPPSLRALSLTYPGDLREPLAALLEAIDLDG